MYAHNTYDAVHGVSLVKGGPGNDFEVLAGTPDQATFYSPDSIEAGFPIVDEMLASYGMTLDNLDSDTIESYGGAAATAAFLHGVVADLVIGAT